MGIPVAVYTTMAIAGTNLSKNLPPEYDVVHVSSSKEAALSELPKLFSGNDAGVPRALVFAGNIPDEDFTEISTPVTATAPGARIVRLTRDDLAAAVVPLPPPGTPLGPPPPGSPPVDPAIFIKLFKDKLAGL